MMKYKVFGMKRDVECERIMGIHNYTREVWLGDFAAESPEQAAEMAVSDRPGYRRQQREGTLRIEEIN